MNNIVSIEHYKNKRDNKYERNFRDMMGDAKFFEGYSRWNDEENRYETWDESVTRVMNMHRKFYADRMTPELEAYIAEAEQGYREKLVVGAQRNLQFGGEQILKNNMKSYNCSSTYIDRPEAFQEVFWILLCGTGCGFSVQEHHVAKLPAIAERKKQAKTHIVEDSIEGWADALGVLMSSFFVGGGSFPEYEGRKVYFDLSKIRPKGAYISGGFKAPGPDGLRKALDRIEYLLQGLALKGIDRLRPINAYDIIMYSADAVLSGGIRRAATICLFSPEDREMMEAKTGNWFEDNPQRGRSNNSPVIVRDEATREHFAEMMGNIREFGEPGFYFVDSKEFITNPCVVPETKILTDEGYAMIGDLVGKKVNIWNGKEFSEVTPTMTGRNENILKIEFSSGNVLECTYYHKFYVIRNGEQIKIEAKDLVIGDKLIKFDLPVIEGNHILDKAYTNGFFTGDGCYDIKNDANIIYLYGDKEELREHLDIGDREWKHHEQSDRYVAWGVTGLCNKYFVPDVSYTITSRLDWFAGLLDADGYATKDGNLQLTSNNRDFLTEIQLMLQATGVQSKVTIGRSERMVLMPNGIGGKDEFLCKETWRLTITNFNKKRLIELGMITHRLDMNYQDTADKSRFIQVTSISDEGRVSDVFCFNEPKRHMGMFNGILTGNCVEIGMMPMTEDGISGVQLCNLSDINGSKCVDKETFYRACRLAAIFGTLQAGYTNFPYLTEATKRIVEREALLGVSITGWMNNPDVLFDAETLKTGAEIVKKVNKEVARLLGINQAARTTCTKPSGSSSVILGTASGIHPEHSKRYIRNIQFNKETEVAQIIKRTNPYMIEESVWSANKTDYVASFPVINETDALYKADMEGIAFLEKVRFAQEHWVQNGTNVELCTDPRLRHNISNTVIVGDNSWDEVADYIFENRYSFSGVSFISASGDKVYPQAPFTSVLTEDELIETYGRAAMFGAGLVVDAIRAGFPNLWEACRIAKENSGDNEGEIADIRSDWIRRFHKFAENYFNGNLDKTEFCLKDLSILHKWTKIQQNAKDIDFAKDIKEIHYTEVDTIAAAACSGPVGCEI